MGDAPSWFPHAMCYDPGQKDLRVQPQQPSTAFEQRKQGSQPFIHAITVLHAYTTASLNYRSRRVLPINQDRPSQSTACLFALSTILFMIRRFCC